MARIALTFMGTVCVAAALGAAPACAADEPFPSKPIQIIVPFGPGGGPDILARQLGEESSKLLKQAVVAVNRVGANGNIAMREGARAAPDGHTITYVSNSFTLNTILYPPEWDSTKDFAPLAQLVEWSPALVVSTESKAVNLAEFVNLAKANAAVPINFAVSGASYQIAMASIAERAGIKVNFIRYKSETDSLLAVLRGDTQGALSTIPSALAYLKGNRLRALAVTGTKRQVAVPDVPTTGEVYSGLANAYWFGFVAPGATPAPVVATWWRTLAASMKTISARPTFPELGYVVLMNGPDEFSQNLKVELKKYEELVKKNNIQG